MQAPSFLHRFILPTAAFLSSVLLFPPPVAGAPGELDLSFDAGVIDGAVRAALPVPGGGWIIAGEFSAVQGAARGGVARIHRDGSLDPAFMDGLSGANGPVHTVVRQEDGMLLIGGGFDQVHGQSHRGIARLQPNGELDPSFNGSLTGAGASVRAIAVQPDGRIVIGGDFATFGAASRNHIARLESDGRLDADFGENLAGASDPVFAIALQDDGEILIGGDFTTIHGEVRNRHARLHVDGSLDTSFGHPFPWLGPEEQVTTIVVEPNESILIGGEFFHVEAESRTKMARLNPDGSLAHTFGPDMPHLGFVIYSLALQGDGKIFIGGLFDEVEWQPRGGIARLHPNGLLDTTFGEGMSGANGTVFTLVLDESSDILLLGGDFTEVNGEPRQRLAVVYPATPPNRAPTDIFLSHASVPEQQPAGTLVGNVTAADPDDGDTHTFTLVSGEGDDGNAFFAIEEDQLVTASPLDYQVQETHSVRIRATDAGGLFTEKIFLIEVEPKAPLDILLSHSSVPENRPAGFAVGTFTAIDPDEGDTHTFALVSGEGDEGNPLFAVEGNLLQTAAVFSHETQSSWSIRVRATDSDGLFLEKTFLITVTPNQAPTDILLSNTTIPENWPAGTTVGSLTASDPDPADSHLFALVSGDGDEDNASFTIAGNLLQSAAVFDAEIQHSRSVRVQATDSGGLTVEKVFTVTVTSPAPALPTPGAVDLTFNPSLAVDGAVHATARQPDGKWIIAGSFTAVNGVNRGHIARLHADGTLDETFMDGLAGANNPVGAVAVQADGRILIGGMFTEVHGNPMWRIARLDPDGTLDASFTNPLLNESVRSIAVQADGRILVGGTFSSIAGQTRNRVARLHANGSLDPSFGSESGGAEAIVNAVALQGDGKVLIGGTFTAVDGQGRGRIARLNADGSLDASFLDGLAGADAAVHSVAVQTDGKILIGGSFTTMNSSPRNRIARLNTDGAVDSSFGEGLAGANGTVFSIAALQDGKALIGGTFSAVNGSSRGRLARLLGDGTVDTSFADPAINNTLYSIALQGDEAKILIAGTFTAIGNLARQRVALLHNGSMPENRHPTGVGLSRTWIMEDDPAGTVVGSFTVSDPDPEDAHTVEFFDPDGSSDNAFFAIEGNALVTAALLDPASQTTYSVGVKATDQGGLWVKRTFTITVYPLPGEEPGNIDPSFDPGSPNSAVTAIARLPDGNWMVAGAFTAIGGHPRGRFARLNADGSLDLAFAEGLPGANRPVTALAAQPNGQIVLGGTFDVIHGVPHVGIARLHANGTLDETFQPNVQVRTGPDAVAVQQDGSVLVGGNLLTVNGVSVNGIARIHPDGSLDESFAPFSDGTWRVFEIQVLDDQKILLAGFHREVTGATRSAVVRLHPDGTIDDTFVSVPVTGSNGVQTFALQPDGRIVIGGDFVLVDGQPRNRIARLLRDGSLDTSFGQDMAGVEGFSANVFSVAVQPDGRIVIGGRFLTINGESRNQIARLQSDGSLDELFGAGLSGANHTVQAVASRGLDILVGGTFTVFNDLPRPNLVLLRGGNEEPTDITLSHETFMENQAIGSFVGRLGAVDPDQERGHLFELVSGAGDTDNAFFSIDGNFLRTAALIDSEFQDSYSIRIRATDWGEATVDKTFVLTALPSPPNRPGPGHLDLSFEPPPIDGEVKVTVLQEDGKVLVGGNFMSVGGHTRGGIARLNTDGSLDMSFADGLAGVAGSLARIETIALQPDGKILIGGWFMSVNESNRPWLARIHPDGSLDTGFLQNLAGPHGPVHSIAIQSDGRIVIGGFFTSVNGVNRNRIARLHPDGSLDTSFGHELTGANDRVETVALDAAERVLIGGQFTAVNNVSRNRIARLNTDGSLDTAFGDGLGGADSSVYSIVPQPNGQLLVGGEFWVIHEAHRNGIARLNADGTVDSDFPASPGASTYAIGIQEDGRILAGGWWHRRIVRLNPDGSHDSTFGFGRGAPNDFVYSVALQDDGRIVIGGRFSAVDGTPRYGVARLHGGNALPRETHLSHNTVAEFQPAGTIIGWLSAVDDPYPPGNNPHTFTFVPGEGDEGNPFFAIDNHLLKTAAAFDVEEQDTYTVRIRAANAKGLWIKRTFTITIEPDSYARWAAVLPEGQRSSADDPGGFGIPNLLRYAFGMDPLQPDRARLPRIGDHTITEGQETATYLTLTYTRRTDDAGLVYIPEASDDLLTWLSFTGDEQISDDGNDETETVTIIDSQPVEAHSQRFLRVRVTR